MADDHDHDRDGERERQLGEVLGAYFEAEAAGVAVDPRALPARHPDLADELREFFAARAAMDGLAAPLRAVAAAAHIIGLDGPLELDGHGATGGAVPDRR